MGQIKYSYCVDEDGNLVHIKDITDATRHARKLYCLQCGQEMVANLCKVKSDYFSHKADTACDGESYLHKLAKRKIKEKFDTSTHFPIVFIRNVPCSEAKHCPCMDDFYCMTKHEPVPSDLKLCDDKVIYDTCQEEVMCGEFRPDLLLTYSLKSEREPVFIVIYKTHKSDDEKLESKYKIIETHKLTSEYDIEDIINNGFVEGQNCELHNFNPKLPLIRSEKIPIDRFVMFKSGSVIVHRALDYIVYCDKINERVNPGSVIELNLRERHIDVWGQSELEGTLNSYEKGLVYLLKKGFNIRNCILCKFYRYNDYYSTNICIRYKSLGLTSGNVKQNSALNCPLYEIAERFKNYPLVKLENEVSEVKNGLPDGSLLPQ